MRARAGALLAPSFLSMAAVRFGGDSPARPPTEADRIKALPDEERQRLTEFVAAILLPEEKTVFLELTEPYQREAFKLDFWARREKPDLPQPLGPGYRDRYEKLRRLADEQYDGWRHDAGRMVLRWGERPRSSNRSAEAKMSSETWKSGPTTTSGGAEGKPPSTSSIDHSSFRAPGDSGR